MPADIWHLKPQTMLGRHLPSAAPDDARQASAKTYVKSAKILIKCMMSVTPDNAR